MPRLETSVPSRAFFALEGARTHPTMLCAHEYNTQAFHNPEVTVWGESATLRREHGHGEDVGTTSRGRMIDLQWDKAGKLQPTAKQGSQTAFVLLVKFSKIPIWLSCILSCFNHVQLFVMLWTRACQASLSLGFSRKEHWSGLPSPPPGNLSNPGMEPASFKSPALAAGFFTT